jgi:1-acyl-sn-glycerol-3-phosphate acyltransferase
VATVDELAQAAEKLSRFERAALALGRWTNESDRGKDAQRYWAYYVMRGWVGAGIRKRTLVEGLDKLLALQPEAGVVQATNHRSFFDQYVAMLPYWQLRIPFAQRMYFPVRSNFFYEKPLGVLVNLLIGGGAMYPPIFRDPAKAALSRDAVDRMVGVLSRPGSFIGVHPEGTRGKGPDPYEFLPAQPGIGQIVLQAKPLVIPCFINGLSNDIVEAISTTYKAEIRRTNPVIIVYGDPVDYSDLAAQKPRATLYKKCSDRILEAIGALSVRERELRAACAAGDIADDDLRWLDNR